MKLGQAHRLAQLRLGAEVVALLHAAFRLLDPRDLDGSFERWLTIVEPIASTARFESAQMAAAYLTSSRTTALGLADRFEPILASELPVNQFRTSMLVTGPISIKKAVGRMAASDEMSIVMRRALDIAEARSSAAAMRHALDGGRQTILQTTALDDRAVGWRRVTGGKSCSFCSMLAGRGAVYSETSVGFHSHDGCSCSAEPVYR